MTRRLSDAQFRAWLATPLSVADLLRIEVDEARYQAALDAQQAEEEADARVRAAAAARAGRPSFARLCELRGQPARAVAARAQQARITTAFGTHLRSYSLPAGRPAVASQLHSVGH